VSPSHELIYGYGSICLQPNEALIVQIPNFYDLYWLMTITNQVTEEVSELGSMYNTGPGFALITSRPYTQPLPAGVTQVITLNTTYGNILPRIYYDPSKHDTIQKVIPSIVMYDISQYTGNFKTIDWRNLNAPKVHLKFNKNELGVVEYVKIESLKRPCPCFKGCRPFGRG